MWFGSFTFFSSFFQVYRIYIPCRCSRTRLRATLVFARWIRWKPFIPCLCSISNLNFQSNKCWSSSYLSLFKGLSCKRRGSLSLFLPLYLNRMCPVFANRFRLCPLLEVLEPFQPEFKKFPRLMVSSSAGRIKLCNGIKVSIWFYVGASLTPSMSYAFVIAWYGSN